MFPFNSYCPEIKRAEAEKKEEKNPAPCAPLVFLMYLKVVLKAIFNKGNKLDKL